MRPFSGAEWQGLYGMEKQIFSDGIGQITVIGGMVRLDFVAYSPTEKDAKGQYLPVFCQRIVMNPETFLHAAAKMQEAAQAIARMAQRPATEPPAESSSSPRPAPAAQPAPPPKRPFP
jgi:hypothetical protein